MKTINLTHVTQRPAAARGTRVGRPQALRRNHTYNPTPSRPGRGARKWGKQYSKVIGNPAMRHAGAGVIWNEV